jgi:hypothetical protein
MTLCEAELLSRLEPLYRPNLVEDWHDRQLKAGDDRDSNISDNFAERGLR